MPRNNFSDEKIYNSSATVLFPASRSRVKTMLSTGEIVHFCTRCRRTGARLLDGKRCAGQTRPHELAYQVTELFRNTTSSPAAITAREMQAFVGLGSRRAEQSARVKVEAWKEIGMNLMVLPQALPFAQLSPCPA